MIRSRARTRTRVTRMRSPPKRRRTADRPSRSAGRSRSSCPAAARARPVQRTALMSPVLLDHSQRAGPPPDRGPAALGRRPCVFGRSRRTHPKSRCIGTVGAVIIARRIVLPAQAFLPVLIIPSPCSVGEVPISQHPRPPTQDAVRTKGREAVQEPEDGPSARGIPPLWSRGPAWLDLCFDVTSVTSKVSTTRLARQIAGSGWTS